MEKRTSQDKKEADYFVRFGPRFKWPGLISRGGTHLACNFGIGEALSEKVRSNVLESFAVVSQMPIVIPEHLFIQISEQVKLFDADVCALQSALEQAPEILQPVSVHATVNIPFRVVDNFVLESLVAQSLIGHECVSVDRAPRFDVSGYVSLQSVLFPIAHDSGADISAALQNANDCNLVFCSSLSDSALALIGVHEASSAADESFVYFHFATVAAHFDNRAVLHCKPDAVKHEPRGFLSDTKSAANFVGTDAVLAVGNHPNCDKPLVERNRRILKDSPHFAGELFAGVLRLAFPHAPSRDEANVFTSASWALDAIWPAALNHEVEAVVSVSEVQDGVLECSGLFHGVLQ